MAMLIDGRWCDQDNHIQDGAYVRPPAVYDQDIAADVVAGLRSEPGRYHLIASMSCPWSQRTLLARTLKGLQGTVPVQIAGGKRVQGYPVNGGSPWAVPGADRAIVNLHELYTLGDPGFTGRVTVPVLWDSVEQRIVSNESSRIMRAFDAAPGPSAVTLVPEAMRAEIDDLNTWLHEGLSNAVYRAGFARKQAAYDEAVAEVFATLDQLETRLAGQRYLLGPVATEVDWRLFPTLVRFDAVYHGLFKCSLRRLIDYPNLWAYARDLYAWPGAAETVEFDLIRRASYAADADNLYGIVAVAPAADWTAPHGREALDPPTVEAA